MILLLIILLLTATSFLPKFFPKYNKLTILFCVFIVLLFFFFLSKNFFHAESFCPTKKIQTYSSLGNYYNFIVNSIKNKHKFYIHINYAEFPLLNKQDIYKNYKKYYVEDKKYGALLDTSLYKGKIYLYFGLTPLMLFYMPFHLITGLYLTDKLLVFVLGCFSFLLLLFFVKKLIFHHFTHSPFHLLVIFILGFCSYLPFILIRSATYEVAISTAMFLLLGSFVILYFYLNKIQRDTASKYSITENHHCGSRSAIYANKTSLLSSAFLSIRQSDFLLFLLGLLLSLSVGARPHYVLFIPIFFTAVCIMNYYNIKNIKYVMRQTIIFLTPCVIIGAILALYNYLRFDSIFEFGWKYQLNDLRQYAYYPTIKDSLLALKYNLFQFPEINKETVFCLAETKDHIFGNEFVTGIVWTYPFVFLFVFLPSYLWETYKKNKNLFCITVLMIIVVIINVFVTSFIGMICRYFFEYMPFIIILSMQLFYYMYSKLNTKFLKNISEIFFVLIFIYSIFINISLVFSNNYAIFYKETSRNNYAKIVKILYKSDVSDQSKDDK